ncbi:MAG: carboxypeptidase regulatory-like domain-containing protein, partial [Methanobacteriota archaeon]
YSVYASVYDLLVGIGEDLTPVPQLARNWSVSPNGLVWTFNLYPGVVWHDDTPTTPRPFTSADVKFTFEYIQTCGLSLFLGYVGDPTDPNAAYISTITTPTPTQVVITTNKPKANMLSLYIPIVPQHIWSQVSCQQAKQGYKNEPPIGTGMYTFVEWRKGQFLRLALNNRYHFLQPTQDYVDEIIYRFYNTDVALRSDFLLGNLDATSSLQPQQFLSLPLDIDGGTTNPDADPDPDIAKFVQDMIDLSMLGFCSATDAVVAQYGVSGDRNWLALNLTVRQAVANAINKTRLVDTIWSGLDAATGQNRALAREGSSLIPPATPFWHYNVTAPEELGFSLAQGAARLSDPAGDGRTTTDGNPPNALGSNLDPNAANNRDAFGDTDGDGVRDVIDIAYVAAQNPEAVPQANRAVRGSATDRLTFGLWIINNDAEAQAAATEFVPNLASIGVEAVVKSVSSAQMLALSLACDYDWYIWGWIFDVDPDFGLSVLSTGQILGWQDAWYSNPTYDAWYVQQQQEVDLGQRQAIVHAMQRLVYRDQPYNVLWYPSVTTVVRSDRFTNWGDWAAHPGLGLTGYGNVFTMLRVTPVFPVANQCPTVVLIDAPVQPRVVFVGSVEAFNGTAIDSEGDPLTWTWVWADGNSTSVNTSAGASSVTVTHAWSSPGDYNITLAVTDNLCGGSTSSLPVWVQVVPPPPAVGWFAGTVTDASTGAPIPGASVTVSPGGGSAVTAVDGTYNLTVAPGAYNVSAAIALYVAQSLAASASGATTTIVNFALSPAPGWITGTVTDASTGAPIGSAVVTVVPGGGNTTTAPDGTYNVTLSPGTYSVTASKALYAPSSQSVTVSSNATSAANFPLAPWPGWIVGTVTDATTALPIAGATVVALPGGGSATTALDGTYNLTVAPGMYNVTASKALYVAQTQALSVPSNATAAANFPLLPAPGWIAGTVTDAATGLPLAGALVTAAPGGANATTAPDGTYNVSVASGTYAVTATKPLYLPSSRPGSVASNATTTVDFQLAPAPGWIAGRVTDVATGSPLGGASLKAVDGTGTEYPVMTAADGTYNVTVPPGTYTVIVVLAAGYVNETFAGAGVLSARTTAVDFQLQREQGWVAGRVTDALTGSPIAGATVVVIPGGANAVTAFDGTYNITVGSGTYTV